MNATHTCGHPIATDRFSLLFADADKAPCPNCYHAEKCRRISDRVDGKPRSDQQLAQLGLLMLRLDFPPGTDGYRDLFTVRTISPEVSAHWLKRVYYHNVDVRFEGFSDHPNHISIMEAYEETLTTDRDGGFI